MVVWTDDIDMIIPLAREFEEKLIKLAWKNRIVHSAPNSTHQSAVTTSSDVCLNGKTGSSLPDSTAQATTSNWSFGWKPPFKELVASKDRDPEKGVPECIRRPMRMFAPFYNGLGCALSLCRSCL